MEFQCEQFFYIDQESYNVTSFLSKCKQDGEFQSSGELQKSCKEKPCEDDDIQYITSTTNNGTAGVTYMYTKSKGYAMH